MENLKKFLDVVLPSGREWDIAKSLIISEEIARIQARKIADELVKKLREIPVSFEIPRPHPSTIDFKDYPISEKRSIINEYGIGILKELVIVAETSSFGCDVFVDGKPLYQGSFESYSEISQFVKTAVAMKREEEGNYVLNFYDVPFLFNLKVNVYALQDTVTFKRIYGKWHVLKYRKEVLQLPEVKKILEKIAPRFFTSAKV